MAGEEYWVVLYKAIADFGDLMRKAAEAKAVLSDLGKTAGDVSKTQVAGEQQLINVRKQEIDALKSEASAVGSTADAYERYNVQALYGGRSDMGSHLTDLRKALEYETLLNRQRWLLFTTPQQAYAWRQNELNQRLLMNRAEWAGYFSADQYLAYLQKQIALNRDMNAELLARAAAYKEVTTAALGYYNALSGTHKTLGELGTNVDLSNVAAFTSAINAIPDTNVTSVTIDDKLGLAQITAWDAALETIPDEVTTTVNVTVGSGGGLHAPDLKGGTITEALGLNDTAAKVSLAEWVSLLNKAPQHLKVTAEFDDAKAVSEAARFIAFIKSHVNVTEHVTQDVLATSGASGGGGGPPPVAPAPGAAPDEPNPNDIKAVALAMGQEAKAAHDAAAANSEEAKSAQDVAAASIQQALALGQYENAAKGAYAYQQLYGAGVKKQVADTPVATALLGQFTGGLVRVAGAFGLLTKVALFGGIFSVSLWHILLDAILEFAIALGGAVIGVLAMAAAVGIFVAAGNLAQDTLGRISDRLKATYTAASATGQAIYPLTQNFDKLASVIRPEIWQLYGDALNLVGGRMGLLGKIAEGTGRYIDQLAGKFIAWFNQPSVQQGFTHLITAGIGFAKQFGDIFLNLGHLVANFFKAAELTHVAEDLGAVIIALTHLAAVVVGALPPWLLALALGMHAIYLWGGLAATAVIALLDPLRALILTMAGVSAADSNLGKLGAEATGLQRLNAVVKDLGAGFIALPGRITGSTMSLKEISSSAGVAAGDLSKVKQYAADTGIALADMVPAATAVKVTELSKGLDQAGKDTLNMAAAAGASSGGLAKLAGGLGSASTEAEKGATKTGLFAGALSALGSVPIWGWVAIGVVALTGLGLKLGFMHDQTMTWLTSLHQVLMAQSVFTVVGTTAQQLAAVTIALGKAQKTGAGNATELASAQQDLGQKLGLETSRVGQLSKIYGTDFVGALALLNTAQVKTSTLFDSNTKVWAADLVQVAGLVQGYKAMGQGLTQLQGDVSVQLVTNADQVKSMQTLNTAWDAWLTTVESGPVAFNAFEQGVQTLDTSLQVAGASLGGLNAQSLTAQANFQSLVPQMGAVQDAIRTYSAVLENGAAGSADLVRGTKDVIAASGQMGTTNQQVRNSLIAVAEEANPAINTWQKLTQWMGKQGAAGSAQDLNNLMTQLQTPTANLSADALKLTTALQQDLNPAMAAAIFNAKGGQAGFQAFATAFNKFGGSAPQTAAAARSVAQELLAIDGNSATAKAQFVGFAEAMGMSSKQANALWTQLTTGKDAVKATGAAADKTRTQLAGMGTEAANLGKPGLWGQIEHAFMAAWNGVVNWFSQSVPHALESAWNSVAGFFDRSFTHDIPAAWNKAWSGLVSPVMHVFDDIKTFISSSFDSWWKTHGEAVKAVWNGIWGSMKSTAEGVFAPIKAAATGLWDFLSSTFGGKGGFLSQIWKGFGDTGKQAWQWIKVAAQDGYATLVYVFHGLEAVAKATWAVMGAEFKIAWDVLVTVVKVVWDLIVGIVSVALDLITGHWHQAWADMKLAADQVWNAVKLGAIQTWNAIKIAADAIWHVLFQPLWNYFDSQFVQPAGNFFAHTLPAWLGDVGNFFKNMVVGFWHNFDAQWVQPAAGFFTHTLPNWLAVIGQFFKSMVVGFWHNFDAQWVAPATAFFTHTLPNWLAVIGQFFKNMVIGFWHNFDAEWVAPAASFFTHTFPSWLSNIGHVFGVLWSDVWTGFNNDVVRNVGHFFTSTMPSWLSTIGHGIENTFSGAFKNAIDTAVGIINTPINFLNNDVLKHLPGGLKIPTIPKPFAAGGMTGSVAGASSHDNINAVLMGGEYVLRQSARQAVEQDFGHGFMDWLNQYDQHSGAGSRGIAASHMAAGGPSVPSVPATGDMGGAFHFAAGGCATGYCAPMATGGMILPMASGGTTGAAAERAMLSYFESKLHHPYSEALGLRLGPTYFDCSGLTFRAAQAAGIPIPQSSSVAASEADWFGSYDSDYTYNGRSQVQTGDILFFTGAAPGPSRYGGIGHVGMAESPGTLISAYDTQQGVARTPISQDNFVVGVRLGGAGGKNILSALGSAIAGFGSAIFSDLEGLTTAGGTALSSGLKTLGRWVKGGAGELLHLAQIGATDVFNGVWDATVNPMVDVLPADTIPGAVLRGGAGLIKQGIDSFMLGQDNQAKASAAASGAPGVPGGVSSGSDFNNLVTIARYLETQGASRAGAAGIAGTIAGESGGNPESVGSGGFGLIGWTGNTTGLPNGYRLTGNASHDLAVQMAGIVGYARSRPGGWPNGFASATDPVAAGNLWSRYEAPKVALSDTRPGVAQQVFAALSGVPAPGGSSAGIPVGAHHAAGGLIQAGGILVPPPYNWSLSSTGAPGASRMPPTPVVPYHSTSSGAWNSAVDKSWAAQNKLDSDYNQFVGGRNLSKLPKATQESFDLLAKTVGHEILYWNTLAEDSDPLKLQQQSYDPVQANLYGAVNALNEDSALRHYLIPLGASRYNALTQDVRNVAKGVTAQEAIWGQIWGPHAGPPSGPPSGPGPITPGPAGVITLGGLPSVDLQAGILGGPASPVASPGTGGLGFGAGGLIPSGDAGLIMPSLADVAGRFGIMVPGLSGYVPVSLPDSFGRGLDTAARRGEPTRSLSAAGAAQSRVGVNVSGDVVINNPSAEKPSDSITRASNRLAVLAGRS